MSTSVPALSAEETMAALAGLCGWELDGNPAEGGAIVKEYRWPTFAAAVAFVVRVGFAAEAANHHPDLDLRFNRVRVALSTHSEGGVTSRDLELATEIERLAGSVS